MYSGIINYYCLVDLRLYLSTYPQNKPCRLIFLDNNIPQISLYYQPVIGDSIPEINRQDWNISYNLGKNWRQATKGKKKIVHYLK